MAKFDANKLLKTLTAGRGAILSPLIDAYQAKGQFPEVWKLEIRNFKPSDGYFHPSSDAFTMPSVLYKKQKGLLIPEKISPALRRTFDCGHMWHEYIQAILIDMGFVTPDNVERYISHRIETERGWCMGAGTGDLIDVQIPGYGAWLVDIKTMNKNEFDAGASERTLLKWSAQVNCYMDWFGADKAMVLAICKDSPHAFREYTIQSKPNLLAEIYDRWCYVAQCVRDNIEPDDDAYLKGLGNDDTEREILSGS